MKLDVIFIYKLIAFVIGVFIGGLSLFMGFLMVGGGHGWLSAFPFGVVALFLTPIALQRLLSYRSTSITTNAIWLAVAVLLDLYLLYSTRWEGWVYFNKVREFAIQWLGVWAVWQFSAALTFFLSIYINRSTKSASFSTKIYNFIFVLFIVPLGLFASVQLLKSIGWLLNYFWPRMFG